MRHEEIKEKLFALYDGPLTEKERVLLEGHLPVCAECRQSIGEWKTLSRTLFARPTPSEASEDIFVSRIIARLEPSPAGFMVPFWEKPLGWLVPLVGSAAIAAWVFFSVLPSMNGLSSSPTIETAFSSDTSYSSSSTESGVMFASYSPSTYDIAP